MSKKSRPSTRKRAASAARRKPAAKRSTRRPGKPTGKPKREASFIELKPIRTDIVRAVEGLKRLPPSEAVKVTIERLTRCIAEFDAICDPDGNDGCGPNMAFPLF